MNKEMKGLELTPFKCAKCGASIKEVIDSRPSGKTIRRRRECSGCGDRITTYEMASEDRFLKMELPIEAMQIIWKFRDEVAKAAQDLEKSLIEACIKAAHR